MVTLDNAQDTKYPTDKIVIANKDNSFLIGHPLSDKKEVELYLYNDTYDKYRFCRIPLPTGEGLSNFEFLDKFLSNMTEMIKEMNESAG